MVWKLNTNLMRELNGAIKNVRKSDKYVDKKNFLMALLSLNFAPNKICHSE